MVSILGTKYQVKRKVNPEKDAELDDRCGYCDFIGKRIVVADAAKLESWKNETPAAIMTFEQSTLRHEIIHAFLFESGLWGSSGEVSSWATNEEMVDWLALQFPKILKAFLQTGCL